MGRGQSSRRNIALPQPRRRPNCDHRTAGGRHNGRQIFRNHIGFFPRSNAITGGRQTAAPTATVPQIDCGKLETTPAPYRVSLPGDVLQTQTRIFHPDFPSHRGRIECGFALPPPHRTTAKLLYHTHWLSCSSAQIPKTKPTKRATKIATNAIINVGVVEVIQLIKSTTRVASSSATRKKTTIIVVSSPEMNLNNSLYFFSFCTAGVRCAKIDRTPPSGIRVNVGIRQNSCVLSIRIPQIVSPVNIPSRIHCLLPFLPFSEAPR